METFAKRLTRLRLDKDLSVVELAKLVGVSQSTYRDWEHGREILGEPYLAIAGALGVSLSYLMTGADSNEVKKLLDELESDIRELQKAVVFIRSHL